MHRSRTAAGLIGVLKSPWRIAAVLLALAGPAAAQPAVIHAPAGAVQGRAEGGLEIYEGIPYAQPPVGALRWRPPQPYADWRGVRQATAFGPACPQVQAGPGNLYHEPTMPVSEDCLTLNVWAPKGARKAPVFFWIHGGALVNGASREGYYDGAKLARHGVVVVSINYRLGVLGWLAHPGLSAESPTGVSGNYGLLDQIAALQWVRRNIATFGGDPSQVTIAGESAGGLSVLYLMASPPAQGLFARAIAESSYMVSTPELKAARYGSPSAESAGVALAASVGAKSIADLRAMDAQKLTEAAVGRFAPFGAIDGQILPRQLVDAFDRGEQAHVPVLVGFNSGEIRSLRALAPPTPTSAAAYEAAIRARYGDLADAFLRLYPSSDLEGSTLAITRDALYGWTAERVAAKQAAVGQPAFLYLFDHGYPAEEARGLHAFHGSELPYVFGTMDRATDAWPTPPKTPAEARLSDAITAYWASFARSGVPTAPGEPAWPSYGPSRAYMAFTDRPQPSEQLMPGMYALQEAVVCRRRLAGGLAWNWNVGVVSPPLPPDSPACHAGAP